MTQTDIITIGASAGGVEAVTRLVRALPADLAVFVVVHFPAYGHSLLPTILTAQGHLHGPYHYRIWRDGLKIRKVYIPITQVQTVQAQCDAYKAVQDRLRNIRRQREELTKNIKRQWRAANRLLRPPF